MSILILKAAFWFVALFSAAMVLIGLLQVILVIMCVKAGLLRWETVVKFLVGVAQ
ncbi:hypothetical protein EP7_004313 [Isosphaeraceae bacterium EP7]